MKRAATFRAGQTVKCDRGDLGVHDVLVVEDGPNYCQVRVRVQLHAPAPRCTCNDYRPLVGCHRAPCDCPQHDRGITCGDPLPDQTRDVWVRAQQIEGAT